MAVHLKEIGKPPQIWCGRSYAKLKNLEATEVIGQVTCHQCLQAFHRAVIMMLFHSLQRAVEIDCRLWKEYNRLTYQDIIKLAKELSLIPNNQRKEEQDATTGAQDTPI